MKKAKKIIDQIQVKHIASLASLQLTLSELKIYSAQLSAILIYIKNMAKLNTAKIKPIWQITGLANVWRKDVIKPSLSQTEALANTKQAYQGYFKVRAIFND